MTLEKPASSVLPGSSMFAFCVVSMKHMSKIILSLMLFALCATSAFAELVDGVAAIINRKVITLSRVREAEREFVAQGRFLANEDDAMRKEKTINFLIEEELVRQRADELGILVTSEEFESALTDIKQRNNLISDEQLKSLVNQEGRTWDEFSEEIKGQIKIAKLINREIRSFIELNDAEIREYYESHKEQFKAVPISVHIRHILLKVEPGDDEQAIKAHADALVLELRNGADFQAVAQANSEHASAESGGELGTFQEGELAAPYNLAFSMAAGEISDPVRSDSGFHILYVEEKSGGADSAFENARARIEQQLYHEKSGARYEEWLDGLKQKAYIQIK